MDFIFRSAIWGGIIKSSPGSLQQLRRRCIDDFNGVYALLYLSESIGITILIYPYTTSETVKILGLKKSRKIAKTIAIAIMALGIAFYTAIVLI
ncbi:hypothetical protein KPL47_00630 [Clostridium estertheticum]|uniref:hypothetical protein n=1 Tax=Clostridium estertheticum TaxID=238834 RepID=UPI001C0C1563|nr:hypothetical protein [Clostridium estertheticum]MBU3174867.1 hypothetical protein [Clostridium estertheticum]